MATLKQKTAIKKTYENIRNKTLQPMGEVMLESGYKLSVSKHPDILTKSKAWLEALKEIDFNKHLRELDQMASIENNQDKDNVLKAKDMLFKIGDKFPAGKVKIGAFEDRDKILE